MEGLVMVLSLSTIMAIASFIAGLLPLSFSLSQSQIRLISTIGVGVLVGTALIVIIPEGVETLYTAAEPTHTHERRGTTQVHPLRKTWSQSSAPLLVIPRDIGDSNPFAALPGPVIPDGLDAAISGESSESDPPRTPIEPGIIGILSEESNGKAPVTSQTRAHNPHAWVGVSLISGFILMYLIDTIPSLAPATPPPRTLNIYSLSDLSSSPGASSSLSNTQRPTATTLGLIIHSAADGIALGASSNQPSLSFIIFLAIMVHKAPAAFGLTSVLLKQGLGKRAARAHLLAFSLAAPLGAIGTWLVVAVLGGAARDSASEESMKWWTGVLLLFSGGTFL
ncbi:hypothetical protein MMC25_004261 [Agyrium rufum]|nr:hypothetical protein [Agyrium rufum]